MNNAIEIQGLCKQYDRFALRDVSFTLPRGCVMGLIGENGAGKSTTIKAILGLIRADSGRVSVLDKDYSEESLEIRDRLGVVLEESNFPSFFTAANVNHMLKHAYSQWNEKQFLDYITRFKLDVGQKISEYSKGMRMKLSIAAAISHAAELLILDEPTSGLDPVVREEILDIFWEYLQNDTHSILLSSHITSDLDKIADYITFIHDGEVLLSMPRDEMLDTFGLIRCTAQQLTGLAADTVVATRSDAYGVEALVRRGQVPQGFRVESVNIEQIMLFMIRGNRT